MSAAQDDLRSQLEAAFKGEAEPEVETPEVEAIEPETPEVIEPETRARDEKGRFAKTEAEPVAVELEPTPEAEPQPEVALAPPNGWTAEAKAKWHELPAEVQQAALKREEDIAKFTSKTDEERSFGREMYRAVQPYMAQIQAEGGTPVAAVQSLLNTAYVLRTGSPEQKRQMLLQTAQQFGVDLGIPQPEVPAEAAPILQYLNPVVERLGRLESTLTQRDQVEQHQLQSEINTEIETFAADPKHAHFQEVKAHMAALLKEGAAKDLQDAYEQACWARADIRATLLAQQRVEEEQKRKAEARRKAEEAKRRSVSLTGGPGNTSAQSAPEGRGLREELEAQFAAFSGAV